MLEILVLVSILFIIGGFLILRDRGITFRKWLFISVLAVLFIMTAFYGSQLIIDIYYPPIDYYVEQQFEERAFIEGLTLMSFGIVGMILLTAFRKQRTQELSIAFGLAGSILLIVGLIDLLRYEEAIAKFIVSMAGVLIISFLIYHYRETLLGEG